MRSYDRRVTPSRKAGRVKPATRSKRVPNAERVVKRPPVEELKEPPPDSLHAALMDEPGTDEPEVTDDE